MFASSEPNYVIWITWHQSVEYTMYGVKHSFDPGTPYQVPQHVALGMEARGWAKILSSEELEALNKDIMEKHKQEQESKKSESESKKESVFDDAPMESSKTPDSDPKEVKENKHKHKREKVV